jgi:NPCBM/NEW2 domain
MHRTTTTAAGAILAAVLTGTTFGGTTPAVAGAAAHQTQARGGVYHVTASVNETEPLVHSKVKIKGSVSPAAPGAQVTVQVRYQGHQAWKPIGHARVSSAGTYRFRDKVNSVRERRYRVVMPATRHRGAGRAGTEKVTVFGWRNLDSVVPLPGGMLFRRTATINATVYPHSLAGTLAPGRIDYNLNRDCKSLDTVLGIDDGSPLGATATISVLGDGAQLHSATYSLTHAERVMRDLTGVFRLTITSSQTGGATAAVGTPKVLCSF